MMLRSDGSGGLVRASVAESLHVDARMEALGEGRSIPIKESNQTSPVFDPTARPAWVPGLFCALLQRRMAHGRLSITWPNGAQSVVRGGAPGPAGDIRLHSMRPLLRMLVGGGLGFAESYIAGDWDSPDLATLIELGSVNRKANTKRPGAHLPYRLANRLRHLRRANTRGGSRRNIAYHYDLGNRFYEQWLDPSLTYSSAIYQDADQSLESAQTHKCRRLLALLNARPGEHLLEIGCGWGNFASLAARERQLRVTAVTLSREQFDFAKRRIFEEGLNEKVHVTIRDYRDIEGTYDHVASVEMFEAVGEAYWPAYFAKLRDSLRPRGRAALQVITIDEALFDSYRRGIDFIQKYIFPGGMLPTRSVLADQVRRAGLRWAGDDGFGQHYARTLAEWRARFTEMWPAIAQHGFDERFRRLWTFYLAYCEGGFRAGNIDVRQVVLVRD